MELIQTNTAACMINYQGMCKNAHFQWQMTYNLNKNILEKYQCFTGLH